MEGISYLVNKDKKPVAVQIDLEKHGEIWEDFFDIMIARSRKDKDSIPLETLVKEMEEEGKLA